MYYWIGHVCLSGMVAQCIRLGSKKWQDQIPAHHPYNVCHHHQNVSCFWQRIFCLFFVRCLSVLTKHNVTTILLLSVFASGSPLCVCMKSRLVRPNRRLTILHRFSNPHPSLPLLSLHISLFPLNVPLFLQWSPSTLPQLTFPNPGGKIII